MKKRLLIIITIMVAILCVGCGKKNEKLDSDIIGIEYSFSNSYGNVVDTAKRIFKFQSDGNVLLSNDYDSSTVSFKITQKEYNELVEYISDRISVFDEKVNEETSVSDGIYSSITITLKNNSVKTMGGYMVTNKEYEEIRNKINELINNPTCESYVSNIGK